MGENDKKALPDYLEVHSGDTLYRIKSVFAEKGDFHAIWETLIVDRATLLSDCKTA